MTHWCDLTIEQLESDLRRWGFAPSHAKPLLRQFYALGQVPTDAPRFGQRLLDRLATELAPVQSTVATEAVSTDGTRKLLIAFPAGGAVESVLMPSTKPGTLAGCLSSQIGCAMGCDFCASTRNGLERNLTAAEIVEQFIHLKRAAHEAGQPLKTIVFMGMGEPMHNLDAVLDAIRKIGDPDLGGLGWRQITVSTVGIVPGIDRLADADLNVHLALSLHAPDDETRAQLVPMNRRYAVAEIMDAARRFYDRTSRIPTIEYCLLAGVNDSPEQADLLGRLLDGFRAHVNVIAFNPIGPGLSGKTYERPTLEQVFAFVDRVRTHGVVAHARRTKGDDVSAACGQLRQQFVALVPSPSGRGLG